MGSILNIIRKGGRTNEHEDGNSCVAGVRLLLWIRACIDVEWAYATITIEMIVARNVGEQMLEKGLRMVDQLDRSSVLCSTFAAL
ncbi:unnamed protein product [Prunus armeniaca]